MEGRIYIHKNKTNGKCYVGQTINKVNRRWRKGEGYKSSPKFYRAIKKYGWDNFEHIVLPEVYATYKELNNAEIDIIKLMNTVNNGYNLNSGGYENTIISKETRMKISIGNKNKEVSKETRIKIGLGNAGKTVSPEARLKISKWRKGKPRSEATKKKITESLKVPIMVYDIISNTDMIYKSALDFANEKNLNVSTIRNAKSDNRLVVKQYYIEEVK